jgi:hypothetical protein
VSNRSFSVGDRVTIVAGKYRGLAGLIVDPTGDSDGLPAPFPGHYWIRVLIQGISVPLHVHEGSIEVRP